MSIKPVLAASMLALLLLISGCGTLLLDQAAPKILSVSPPDGAIGVNPLTAIRVVFSEAMDKETAERAFSLSCSGNGNTTGVFSWSGNTLIFAPKQSLDVSQEYIIKINQTTEDKNGNNLLGDFTTSFSLAGKNTPPQLLRHIPEDATFVASRTNDLFLAFSTNMDISSLHSAFSINPSLTGILSLISNGTTLRFHPTMPLVHATIYTVKLSTDARDAQGNLIDQEYSFSFTIGTDFIQPSLVSFSTQGGPDLRLGDQIITNWHRRLPVVLLFSEAMSMEETKSAFSIKPPVDGDIRMASNALTFTPTDGFLPETVYTIQIGDSASDLQGNRLPKTEKTIIKTDAADSRYLRVTGLYNETNSPWTQNIVIPIMSETVSNLNIHFSAPVGYLGILPNFSIDYFSGAHPSSGGMIGDVRIISNNTIMQFDLLKIGENNIYKLTIDKDAVDLLENPMQDDWVFFFQT